MDSVNESESEAEEYDNIEENSNFLPEPSVAKGTKKVIKSEGLKSKHLKSDRSKPDKEKFKHKETKSKQNNSEICSSKSAKNKNSKKSGNAENKEASKIEDVNTAGKSNIVSSNAVADEYEFDSSDEEDIRNTIGNVPIKWYDDYPHLGYNWDGQRILKPEKGDQLDNFLKRMEDPDFWRTIKDPQTGQDVVLSESDIQLITRIQKQKIPDSQFDEYTVGFYYLFLH